MPETTGVGKLIALDGYGPDLGATARLVLRSETTKGNAGGISKWDASSVFYELRLTYAKAQPSPRTLVLLYAADLAFRVRWEVRPALDEGQCVVAAPYLETVFAFGRAAGLPRRWMAELFSFAPKPQVQFRIPVPDAASLTLKRSAGFIEHSLLTLAGAKGKWDAAELQQRIREHLDAIERRGLCRTVHLKVAVKVQGT